MGKENRHDHSIAAPLIIRGPGIPAGRRSEALVHHVDLFPILCELADILRPESVLDGVSLVPLWRGEAKFVREDLFGQFYSPEYLGGPLCHTQRAVRTEYWKLIWLPLIGRYQLFVLMYNLFELEDLLAPWRIRRRPYIAAGYNVWQKDTWAARDVRPEYTAEEIESVAENLHTRLFRHMEGCQDPLLQDGPLPTPLKQTTASL